MRLTVLIRLYNLLLILALPGVLLRLLWRSRKNPGYAKRIGERFGFYARSYQPGGIVLHAVSVGETVAAQPFIQSLLQRYPHTPITITSTTPTGSATVKDLFGDKVQHVYLPYDYAWALARFFNCFKPSRLIIMETEWWPNLFLQAKKRGIPLYLVNARLSDRSFHGYQRMASLSKKMAHCITGLAAQTQSDADHFIALGVPADRVQITGNMKADFVLDPSLREQAAEWKTRLGDRPVWIAASTHAGEEALVIQTIQAVLSQCPEALCIVVPRHPERFLSFYQALIKADLRVARRSLEEPIQESTQVYLGDTLGDLLLLYGLADQALVAGSFVPAGGHNMLEAISMGCPVIMGPHLENVRTQAADLVKAQAMIVVDTPEALTEQLIHWFHFPQDRHRCLQAAQACLQANRGAVDRTFKILEE